MSKGVRRGRAVALAAALVGGGAVIKPRMADTPRPLVQAALALALVGLTRAPLGLGPPAVWSGVRLGLAASAPVGLGMAAAAQVPALRVRIASRPAPNSTRYWLLVRIPLGTAWAEEAAFRAALGWVAAAGFGRRGGRVFQAAAFGLWHIADARAAGDSMLRTVVLTGAAGWLFALLRERSGSLAAPMLVHLTVNEAGAIAALWARRRSGRRASRRKSAQNWLY